MHYFIDGYNLMFRVLRAGDDLKSQRNAIIINLTKKIHVTGIIATLIFDAQYQEGESQRSHYQNLEIQFTDHGETADECILHLLKGFKNPRDCTVVTSDKKLAWLVRRQGSLTETVEDFLKSLHNRYQNKIKRSKQPHLKVAPSKPAKISTPIPEDSSVEACYEYYLERFEKAFQEMSNHETTKKSIRVSKTKKRTLIKKFPEEKGLSNMERWKKAFERALDDEDFV